MNVSEYRGKPICDSCAHGLHSLCTHAGCECSDCPATHGDMQAVLAEFNAGKAKALAGIASLKAATDCDDDALVAAALDQFESQRLAGNAAAN
jgi:hypothetical protein